MNSMNQPIENWLLEQPGWVSAKRICEQFGVKERDLRQDGKREGLMSKFAICSNRGFRHIARATAIEVHKFEWALRSHALRAMARIETLEKRRAEMVTHSACLESGQAVFDAQNREPIKQ